MNSEGEMLETGVLRFERLLPGPVERVWSWIADGDKRAEWLCGGGDSNSPGAISFDFNHNNLTPHDDPFPEKYKDMTDGISFQIEVTKADPPHHMVWYWPTDFGANSEIEITLKEEGDQVRLILIQRGYDTEEDLTGSCGGWHTHLDIMVDKLNGEIPKPFWEKHERLAREYAVRFADVIKTLG